MSHAGMPATDGPAEVEASALSVHGTGPDIEPEDTATLAAEGPAHGREPTGPESNLARLRRGSIGRFAVVGVWGVMILAFALDEPKLFLQKGTFQTIFGSEQALVFLTMALVCTFVVGEFDLSVPSIMGLSATIVPVLVVTHHVNLWLACVIAVVAAVAAGTVNGLIVVVAGVDAIVTTLGMGTLLVGLALWMSNLTTVSGLSSGFAEISTTQVLGLPISFFYGLGIAVLFAYILARTPLGRHMTFVGANREVARLAGVRVDRLRFGSFVTSGLICGLGGVVLTAGIGGFDPTTSASYLLPTFAAAFLSTAVIVPGRFNPLGALIAIYFLETGIVGLQLLGYTGWISDVFFGAALVVAVTISTVVRRRSARA